MKEESSFFVSQLLPADAREIMLKASKTEVTRRDPNARTREIDKATEKIRRMYPHLFR